MLINPVEWYTQNGWRLTSPYGPRTGQFAGFHRGVDFGGKPCGAPVQTPFAGKVVTARTSGMGTWGNTVCIELAPDGNYVSLNAHLQRINVRVGQFVEVGDVIGTNGGTNHSGRDYACHIHYEIQRNNGSAPWRGDHINPATFTLEQISSQPSKKFKVDDIVKNIVRSNVNVRKNPGTFNPVTGSVNPREQVIILDHRRNGIKVGQFHWWRIRDGWIAEEFFEVVIPEPSSKFEVGDIVENIIRSGVNIRSNPGTVHSIVGSVRPREQVEIIRDTSNGVKVGRFHWWRIRDGWIAEDFFNRITIPVPPNSNNDEKFKGKMNWLHPGERGENK